MTSSPSSLWLAVVDMQTPNLFFEGIGGEHLSLDAAQKIAITHNCSLAEVERAALQHKLMPTRYIRNDLDCEQQLSLYSARIAVIGCGGLGGIVATLLARAGIGFLRLIDPDTFEEHNMNRQYFCNVETIGQPKAEVAATQLKKVNPAIICEHKIAEFCQTDMNNIHLVIDCLDSVHTRLELNTFCKESDVPLVHGAVSNWFGQVGVADNTNGLIELLYGSQKETPVQNPVKVLAPTVTQTASIQAAEAIKLVLGYPSRLNSSWLNTDLLLSDFDIFSYLPD